MVEEVLDLLHIDQCSVMAHSAGAPYALSFANRVPERIKGDLCLLAPWVGGNEAGMFFRNIILGILLNVRALSWLQVAEIRAQRSLEDRTSCRMEDPGLDDRKAPDHCLRGHRLYCSLHT